VITVTTDADPQPVGTLTRPEDLHNLAATAGYRGSTVVGIEHPFWRFYQLAP
jgi:hypothetical protein